MTKEKVKLVKSPAALTEAGKNLILSRLHGIKARATKMTINQVQESPEEGSLQKSAILAALKPGKTLGLSTSAI